MHSVEFLQKLAKSPELQDIEWALCTDKETGAYYWLTHWATTLDTHDETDPLKPFPEKQYIKVIVDFWLKNKLVLFVKSRQMMFSWLAVALYLHDTQFNMGRLNFFQSKKEEDADDLVKRAFHIWERQPNFLKRYKDKDGFHKLECNPQNKGKYTYCRMHFPAIYSEIRGVPQGGDVLRMHTASGIFSDEMGFQPEARAGFTASKPTISGKGRFTGISTVEDNSFFMDMVYDRVEI